MVVKTELKEMYGKTVYVCNFCGTSFISVEQAESCFDEDIKAMRASNDRYVDEKFPYGDEDIR